jgi:transcription termination factor Rho
VLKSVDAIEETPVGDFEIPHVFEEQTVIDPQEQLRFETEGGPLTMRVVDLMTPVGKGQRGLIVAPPRTGKTILLQQLAGGVAANHPEVYTIVLLVDERPEEVTEMRRSVHGEVIASSNDLDVNTHVQVAKIAVKRAIRLTETGKDVLVLLDSLTRLGRAFNTYVGSSGRTMTGGLDIRAMEYPKRLFGAARNLEGGGSLTIVASALIDTGSRMDEFIFQEFKGTGNMELVLDRDLANLRIWPAMNIPQSGTRKEELLLDEDTLNKVNRMRRQLLDARSPQQSMQTLLEKLEQFPDNKAFLANLAD